MDTLPKNPFRPPSRPEKPGFNPFRPTKDSEGVGTADAMDILNNTFHHWIRYLEEYVQNPDRVPVTTYENMYLSDETVFSGIEFMVMSCLSRLGPYTHEDESIREDVRDQLDNMEGQFTAAVADIMSAWVYGFSVTEILWRRMANGKIGLRGLQTLHPATLKIDIHRKGPNKNKPRVVHQFFRQDKMVTLPLGDSEDKQRDIPLNKVILYTHNGKFGNPYGTSRLKRVYKNWKIKDVILKAWGLTCERYGSPYTVAKTTGLGEVTDPVTGKKISAVQNMINVTKALGLRGSAVIDKNDEIDIVYGGQSFGDAFAELVGYCNKMTYRGIGLPSLIADNGNVGSHSLGKEHFKLFFLTLEHLAFEVIDVLIEQLIRPMIVMNHGEQDSYGTFVLDNFQTEDAKVLAETFLVLAQGGLVSADKLADVNAWRERLGLELWSEEDLQPSAPPSITGLEPETEEPTAPPTEERIEARAKPGRVYSYSLAERRRNMRKARLRRWSTPAEVDAIAEELAEFASPRSHARPQSTSIPLNDGTSVKLGSFSKLA